MSMWTNDRKLANTCVEAPGNGTSSWIRWEKPVVMKQVHIGSKRITRLCGATINVADTATRNEYK
jgi:hypothetical protein